MTVVKNIGEFFRSSSTKNTVPLDSFEVLTPLLNVQEYVSHTIDLFSVVSTKAMNDLCTGRKKIDIKNVNNGIAAYKDFFKKLNSRSQSLEHTQIFSSIVTCLNIVRSNLNTIEDNFTHIFDVSKSGIDENNLRSSSLVVIGYIETVSGFCTWASSLVRHLTSDSHELIPPFETKSLLISTEKFANFVDLNINRWSGSTSTIIDDIRSMHKKGTDVAIKSGDTWFDTFVEDSQFSPTEQDLMTASMRSPMMMKLSMSIARQQAEIDLLTNRKDWLISKIAFESEKMRGLDPESPEYKKLKKATEYYSNLVSKFEQKLERARV